MSDENAFGQYLQQLRKSRGFSRQQLADAAHLSYPYISQLERGFKTERGVKKKPSQTALAQLAEALGVPVEDLARQAGVSITARASAPWPEQEPLGESVTWHPNPQFTAESTPPPRRRGATGELDQARTEVLPALRRLLATYSPATRLSLLNELQGEVVRELTGS